jgi:hypothetical protein
MQNEFINTLRLKTDLLETSLQSESIYAQARALTTVYDICRAAILSLPDIIDIHDDFFNNLKELRPVKFLENEIPEPPKKYLCEESEN